MTHEHAFEEALTSLRQSCAHVWDVPNPCWPCTSTRIENVRSAHAACIEEARREGALKYRDYVESDPETSQEQLAYKRGLCDGAEREREECAVVCDERGIPSNGDLPRHYEARACAAAIRARSKRGDA